MKLSLVQALSSTATSTSFSIPTWLSRVVIVVSVVALGLLLIALLITALAHGLCGRIPRR
jgi:uncharacterized membrane protein YkvI